MIIDVTLWRTECIGSRRFRATRGHGFVATLTLYSHTLSHGPVIRLSHSACDHNAYGGGRHDVRFVGLKCMVPGSSNLHLIIRIIQDRQASHYVVKHGRVPDQLYLGLAL